MSHLFLFANIVDDLINDRHNLGGEGAFVAAAIAILKKSFKEDVSYTLGGRIGNDESGRFLKRELESLGVDTSGLTVSESHSCQAIVRGVEQAEFVGFSGGPVCRFTPNETKRFSRMFLERGWFFLTSNTLYDDETWEQIRSILKTSPRLLFFDINWRAALLEKSGLSFDEFCRRRLMPVMEEASIIKGTQEEIRRFKDSIEKAGPMWLLETRGSNGSFLRTRSEEIIIEAPKVKEVQDTGAGDTFSGSLLFDLARRGVKTKQDLDLLTEDDLRKMLQLASQVAAMTVQGFGVDYLNKNRSVLLVK